MGIGLSFPEGCALVAGGCGAVGAGVTRQLAVAGLPVTFTYVGNEARARELETRMRDQGLRVWARRMDLNEPASIDEAISFAQSQGGRLHTIACTAGARVPHDNIADLEIEKVERFMAGDVMAYYRLVNRGVPVLRAGGGGSITLCTTIALARVICFDGISPFSKGAVHALARQVAWEEAAHGIRCNTVPISWVSTESSEVTRKRLESVSSPKRERFTALFDQIRTMMRLPGPVPPEQVGNLFAFLASEQAAFITGQSISADGGATL
jgi:NAD(P)-dependent dehydrogenase (short-subunit alcohol dehydrogenase family)